MKKRHKRIRNGVVALTIITVTCLLVYEQRVKQLSRKIDYQIAVEKEAVNKKNEQLEEAKEQLDNMDSLEYVKKIAEEQLGMYDEDTIVFKVKK